MYNQRLVLFALFGPVNVAKNSRYLAMPVCFKSTPLQFENGLRLHSNQSIIPLPRHFFESTEQGRPVTCKGCPTFGGVRIHDPVRPAIVGTGEEQSYVSILRIKWLGSACFTRTGGRTACYVTTLGPCDEGFISPNTHPCGVCEGAQLVADMRQANFLRRVDKGVF